MRVQWKKSTEILLRAEKYSRPDETRIDFLATAKTKNFSDYVSMRINKTAPQPKKETQSLYIENKLEEKEKFPVGYPRFANLEEVELRKRVFTGDSNAEFEIKNPPTRITRMNTKIDSKGIWVSCLRQ